MALSREWFGLRRWAVLAALATAVLSCWGMWGWFHGYPPSQKNRQATLRWLERPIDMPYEGGSTLYEILRDAYGAGGREGTGIVVYLDPVGLAEANVSYNTPVRYSSRGASLSRSLAEMLEPLGLGYWAEYNPHQPCLIITSLQDVARREAAGDR